MIEHVPTNGRDRRFVCASCGEDYAAVWYEKRGLWVAPELDPCPLCKVDTEVAARRITNASLLRGGFIPKRIGYDFDHATTQGPNEAFDVFCKRVESAPGTLLGIAKSNVRQVEAIRRWDPRQRQHPRSLVLQGPPGSGKTTLLHALARRLTHVSGQPEHIPITVDEVGSRGALERLQAAGRAFRVRMPRAVRCRFVRLADVVDAQRLRVHRSNPIQAKKLAEWRGVLFLDDVGLADEPDKAEAGAVTEILCHRIDHGACTVISTNRDAKQLRMLYGERVSDRLEQATFLSITGQSWRST